MYVTRRINKTRSVGSSTVIKSLGSTNILNATVYYLFGLPLLLARTYIRPTCLSFYNRGNSPPPSFDSRGTLELLTLTYFLFLQLLLSGGTWPIVKILVSCNCPSGDIGTFTTRLIGGEKCRNVFFI